MLWLLIKEVTQFLYRNVINEVFKTKIFYIENRLFGFVWKHKDLEKMLVVLHQAQTSSNPKRHMPIGNLEMPPVISSDAMFYLFSIVDPVKWKPL